jgi:hypothetical protein
MDEIEPVSTRSWEVVDRPRVAWQSVSYISSFSIISVSFDVRAVS